MDEILFSDISTVHDLISKQKLSPVELTEKTLDQINKYESTLNAFITIDEEGALSQAKKLEEESSNGIIRGPLHGIPISVKDMVQTKDVLTTGGSKIFENWVPSEDATVISKLKNAGAIIVGKVNLHEFAMGASSENPHYGSIKNPWDLTKIPGGSSGGSAVSTAVGMSFGSVGTDTAGSVRLPAAMCGTVGIKPTYGLVSRHGGISFSWSLDHIGPMTRTVKDAARMLDVMKGFDQKDHSSSNHDTEVMFDSPLHNLKGFTLGFPEEYMFSGIDDDVKVVIEKAFQRFKELGAEIVPIELPLLEDALKSLRVIAQSEVLAYHRPFLDKYADKYGDDLRYRFNYGQDITAEAYINAQRIRNKFIATTNQQMKGIDALIGPTNVQSPFELDTMVPEQAISNMFTLGKTPLANILGFPALSVASGFTKEKLPVGLQLIGKAFADQHILKIGECYERSENWVSELAKNTNYSEQSVGQ